ncbi:MAG TPA: TonB-dependent receptor [Vicinamibacterales bacterium]|nr:TonB-dependent receptor [Vicinamibacterales bacterium]
MLLRQRGLPILLTIIAVMSATPVLAQAQRDARVQVTVVDQTGGVVPNATVKLTGLETATQARTVEPATTATNGVATIERVLPGRYSITAEFPGFDLGLLRDIRVRAGESRHVVVLPLAKLEDAVTVGRNLAEVAADRRTSQFGNTVAQAQIDGLSDDPTELQRQLQELAGPDAIIRVDSFEGQMLPPKAQIKSIHVVRDQFAAESANPGSTFVDVITQPGVGPIRGGLNFNFRDDVLIARSPLVTTKGPEQSRGFSGNIGGALVRNRTSFSANLNGISQYTTPVLTVARPGGAQSIALGVQRPETRHDLSAMIDHDVTRNQTVRFMYSQNRIALENLGIGAYDEIERGWGGRQLQNIVRIQHAGPLGRRAYLNSRIAWSQMDLDLHSNTEAQTIRVLDSFTAGGAQQRQDMRYSWLQMMADVDYVRGVHSFRTGIDQWFQHVRNIQENNYLGTYTFSSLADFEAGRPSIYNQVIGDPKVTFLSVRTGIYFQDDIKLKGLTLSPGLRYSVQNLVNDHSAFEPRFGLTWSPRANGGTVIRGSIGWFHGFIPEQLYEQTLRIDGQRQREYIIRNPSYPNPGDLSALPPTAVNRYLLGDDFHLQQNFRWSAGIDQVISPRVRVNVLYNWIHLQEQPRGLNMNPLVNGVRLDPNYGNVIASVTDSEIKRHEVFVNSTISLAAPSPALSQARFNWRRMNIQAGYSWIRPDNNSDGWFSVPPTGNIEDDWGPGPADQPYRINIVATGTQLRNLTTVLTWIANAGQVYNETTGRDDNGDGIVNDRLPGVGLRSLRGDGQFTMNARLTYAIPLGGAAPGAPAAQARYRLNLFANVQNVANRRNYGGYSGVITSDFYLRPTFVQNPRRAEVGMNLNF